MIRRLYMWSWRWQGPVLLSYILLALLFTYPLVLHLATHVPGDADGDVPIYIWGLWWTREALLGGLSPLYTDLLFAPYGVSLVFHALVFAKAFPAIPLQGVMSPWAASNLLILFAFSVSAFTLYLLARKLTGSAPAAWVAGLVYGFSPYMVARSLGHLNYLSGEWMPLYVLCLLHLLEGGDRRWAWGTGLSLLLTAYSEYYYLIYLTIFTGLFLGWRMWKRPREVLNARFLGHFCLAGLVVVLGFSPILWNLLGGDSSGYIYGGWSGSAKLGADLLAFFTPPPGSLLYGNLSEELFARFSGGNWIEATVFTGYAALAMALWAGWRLRAREEVRLWVGLTLCFFLLSLGPLLHVGGDFVFGAGPLRFAVPLPYIGVHYLPLFKGARVPARFDILVQLGLALLCAFALREWLAQARRPRVLATGIALLVALEYCRWPYPISPVEIPPVYGQIAADERRVAVLEVPLGWRTGWGSTGRSHDPQQVYQMVHRKPLVGGFASRVPQSHLEKMRALPGVDSLLVLQAQVEEEELPTDARRGAIRAQLRELLDHLPDFVVERALGDASVRSFLQGEEEPPPAAVEGAKGPDPGLLVEVANLGYVIVHPPYSTQAPLVDYITRVWPLEKFYEVDGVLGFRVVRDSAQRDGSP